MAIKIFLDTNIVLDILDNLRANHTYAIEIFEQIESGNVKAYISESVVTTADYLLQKNLNKQVRITLISELLISIHILPFSNTIGAKALQNKFEDLEDAILYEIAKENKLDFFITNDKSLGKNLSTTILPVLSAKEFSKIIQ